MYSNIVCYFLDIKYIQIFDSTRFIIFACCWVREVMFVHEGVVIFAQVGDVTFSQVGKISFGWRGYIRPVWSDHICTGWSGG